ncbi:MAG TPA: hypothetical protein PK247_03770 [Candidatus Goldiibacteriota bacterium]|nr:hypothetical protein [Candidatus Goldiibacteriota bacterium]HPN64307.1 hypothetical protein [Candidatus Goldiibacteriota bacterium]
MKKLSVILVSALLITSFFIACNTKAPSSPQAEQATATPIGTFTTTPTITPTVTITATMVCGVKFGSSSDTANGSSGAGNLFAHKFTAITETSLTTLSLKLYTAGKYCIGIYSDNAGTPGNMITWTGVKTASAAGWNSAELPAAYNLAQGDVFWIVYGADVTAYGNTDAAYIDYYRYSAGITPISAIETAGTMPVGGTWNINNSYRHLVYATGCSY